MKKAHLINIVINYPLNILRSSSQLSLWEYERSKNACTEEKCNSKGLQSYEAEMM